MTRTHESHAMRGSVPWSPPAPCWPASPPAPAADPGSAPLASAGPEGVDDGTALTLWTRAPLEKQANLLVDAYNASHENQVEAHRRARTTTTSPRSVPRPAPTACPTCSPPTSSTCPTGSKQGLFQDLTANIDGLDFKDSINKGHLAAGTADGKEHVLPFVLDLSMLFWNKELFTEAGLDPEQGPTDPRRVRRGRQGHPGAEQARHLRHRHGPQLRRLPRLHLVPERVGRRRAGHERGRHRVAARRATPRRRSTAPGPTSGSPAPCCPRRRTRPAPPGPPASPRARSALMPYPATLLSSTPFDVGVAGIPGPKGGGSTFVGGDGIGVSKDSQEVRRRRGTSSTG